MHRSIFLVIYAAKVAYFNLLLFWGVANCDEMSGIMVRNHTGING